MDADTLLDEFLARDPAAEGLIEALYAACFRFAFNATLKHEYRPRWATGVFAAGLEQLLLRIWTKGTRAKGSAGIPSDVLEVWDPHDHHLLHAAIRRGAAAIVTSERRLLAAAAVVRDRLGIEVIGTAEAAERARQAREAIDAGRRRCAG